jgi:hypothetical protein
MQKREQSLTEELDEFWKTSGLLARERKREEQQLKGVSLPTIDEADEDIENSQSGVFNMTKTAKQVPFMPKSNLESYNLQTSPYD